MATSRRPRLRTSLLQLILAAFGLLALVMIAAAWILSSNLTKVKSELTTTLASQIALVDATHRYSEAVRTAEALNRSYLITGEERELQRYTVAVQSMETYLNYLRPRLVKDPETAPLVKQLTDRQALLLSAMGTEGAIRKDRADTALYLTDFTNRNGLALIIDHSDAMEQLVSQVLDPLSTRVEATRSHIEDAVNTVVLLNMAQPVATVLVGLVTVLFFILPALRRLRTVESFAEKVSNGDLRSKPLDHSRLAEIDSLIRSVNSIQTGMRSVTEQIVRGALEARSASEELGEVADGAALSAGQIALAMGDLAAGTQTEAGAVGQVSVIMSDLQGRVVQIAAGAQQQAEAVAAVDQAADQITAAIAAVGAQASKVRQTSAEAAARAIDGQEAVQSTLQGMEEIGASSAQTAATMQQLSQRTAQINSLVADIQQIANQTNLLALNAAIEAARAGEAGRGFAVVAEEVRKLAESSRSASQQIAELAVAMEGDASAAIRSVAANQEQAHGGLQRAQTAAANLGQILTATQATSEAAAAIAAAVEQLRTESAAMRTQLGQTATITTQNAAAANEMADGVDQVGRHLQEVSNLTSTSAASAQEVAASAEELTASTESVANAANGLMETANELRQAVERFRF